MKKVALIVGLLVAASLLNGCGSREKMLEAALENTGYGVGVDWANRSDDDPSIDKAMDITRNREEISKSIRTRFGEDTEADGTYEKPWWDYIPDSYDLSGDVFPKTLNFAGEEKKYNNSLMQSVISDGYTSGQLYDMGTVRKVADSFIYEEMKSKYSWTADLDKCCEIADSFNVADFSSKSSVRPIKSALESGEDIRPSFLKAVYTVRTVEYSQIGMPKFGGYEFTINVWEDEGKLVGWKNDYSDGSFMDEKEIYENMGEWDFYDSLEAIASPDKVVAPKEPNGVKLYRGEKDSISKEQYVSKKAGGGVGTIYYYGNGITVDMTYYGKGRGGSFDEALKICRTICGNN